MSPNTDTLFPHPHPDPDYVPASELALIFVILVIHKLHIMIIIVNDT